MVYFVDFPTEAYRTSSFCRRKLRSNVIVVDVMKSRVSARVTDEKHRPLKCRVAAHHDRFKGRLLPAVVGPIVIVAWPRRLFVARR